MVLRQALWGQWPFLSDLYSIIIKWAKQGCKCSVNEWETDMNRHFKFVAEKSPQVKVDRDHFSHWMNHYLYKQARWTRKGAGLLKTMATETREPAFEPKQRDDPSALLNLVLGKFVLFHVCHPQNATSFDKKNKRTQSWRSNVYQAPLQAILCRYWSNYPTR